MRLSTTVWVLSVAAGVAAAGGAPVNAADPNMGRNLAANCTNCHNTDGRSIGGMPILAGQDKNYIVKQMQDFKTGVRPGTIMQQLAKGYTDEQIAAIAAFFAAQK